MTTALAVTLGWLGLCILVWVLAVRIGRHNR